jgi:hypothetical protein
MDLETIPSSYGCHGDNADKQMQHNGMRCCTQAYWQPVDACSLQFFLRRFFSNSDYVASNERVISERWIGKDVEESGSGLI